MELEEQKKLAFDISMMIYQKIRLIDGYKQTSYKTNYYYGTVSHYRKKTLEFVNSFESSFDFDPLYSFDDYRTFMSRVENDLKDFFLPLHFRIGGDMEHNLNLIITVNDFQEALKDESNLTLKSMSNMKKFNL